FGHEIVVDAVLDDNPLGGDAVLAQIDETPAQCRMHGALQIGIVADYQRILAAQFHGGRGQIFGAALDDAATVVDRTDEQNLVHAAAYQGGTGFAIAVEDLHGVGGKAFLRQCL